MSNQNTCYSFTINLMKTTKPSNICYILIKFYTFVCLDLLVFKTNFCRVYIKIEELKTKLLPTAFISSPIFFFKPKVKINQQWTILLKITLITYKFPLSTYVWSKTQENNQARILSKGEKLWEIRKAIPIINTRLLFMNIPRYITREIDTW